MDFVFLRERRRLLGRDGASGSCSPQKFLLAPLSAHKFPCIAGISKKPGNFLLLLFLGGNTIGIVCKDSWTPLTVDTLTALALQQFFLAPSLLLGYCQQTEPFKSIWNIVWKNLAWNLWRGIIYRVPTNSVKKISRTSPKPNSQISKTTKLIFILKHHNNRKTLFSTTYFIFWSIMFCIINSNTNKDNIYGV